MLHLEIYDAGHTSCGCTLGCRHNQREQLVFSHVIDDPSRVEGRLLEENTILSRRIDTDQLESGGVEPAIGEHTRSARNFMYERQRG